MKTSNADRLRTSSFVFSRSLLSTLLFAFGSLLVLASASAQSVYRAEEMTVNGVQREYRIYIPDTVIASGKKAPAVLVFHGFQSDPNGIRWLTGADKNAKEHGFILIYPAALNKSWNAGRGFGSKNATTDDLSFAAALVDVIKARHPIDPDRIFAMGFSNGAQMVALMACKLSSRIAGGAMVAHTLNINGCAPTHRVPMITIHGTKDTMAPFDGGGPLKLRSHEETVNFFRETYKTLDEGKVVLDKPTVRCTRYEPWQVATAVVDCVCDGNGHTWPGGVEFKVELFGTVNKELNANDFILKFFLEYSGPPPSLEETAMSFTRRPAYPASVNRR